MGEFVGGPNPGVVKEKIYVAVSKNVKDCKLNLIWAIQNSAGKKICILHVHEPATTIPLMGAKFPASALKDQEGEAYGETETQNMHKILNEYLLICHRMGVPAEKLHIERDCIEKGIVELVSDYDIRELVMGAASDKSYSRNMMDLRSKKAIYVREQASASCHIQFICKGHLIYTRYSSLDKSEGEAASPVPQQRSQPNAGRANHLRSQSIELGRNQWVRLTNPAQDLFRRVRSDNARYDGSMATVSCPDDTEGLSTSHIRLGTDVSSDESEGLSGRSPSVFSTFSNIGSVEAASTPDLITERIENVLDLGGHYSIKGDLSHSSLPSVLDGEMDYTLCDQLEQTMGEAENARQDAYQETVRSGKTEKDAIDTIRRAKASEISYTEELKLRNEVEEAMAKTKEEVGQIKIQRDKVNEELRLALDQKSSLESQVSSSELTVKELEQKIISAVGLLQSFKKERDELEMQCDNVLREAEELRKKSAEAPGTQVPQFFSEFSFPEIEEATNNFSPSLKIGEGGYGIIFKGMLRHTDVAIKMLNTNSLQGPSEFQKEVDILSKLRHPNVITLIGACPDSWALVYEYLPNGSLEDRLSCKDNTPPLSWQTRIRIAAELCSALIFLHSSKPHSIVHGDLKPSNILLDANLSSKLSDFRISRLLSRHGSSSNNTTECWRTDQKGTSVYMDPEFLASGELTPKSDIYSLGIILLRLLTGRPASGIRQEVESALNDGKLKSLLDPLAGDWPFVQAEQVCRLALRCCEMNRKSRPDLYSDVWRILEPMKASSGGTNVFRIGSRGLYQTPSYFICPIFQEVMQDPHVAADGFTYEAEAIRGWLDSGHETSPMTNDNLVHSNLVPNIALRSAIQDWLQNR